MIVGAATAPWLHDGAMLLAALVFAILLIVGHFIYPSPPKPGARMANNICAACGYDLRATPDRCPECGTPAAK